MTMLIILPIALRIQHHMPVLLLIIWLHMLLSTQAELIKIHQRVLMVILMIPLHILLLALAESMKGGVGYFKRKQKNLQAHGYRCSFHLGVFQSIDFPKGT